MRAALLNGLTPAQFLRNHWQKKPLLARAALPQFAQCISRDQLMTLAQQPEAETRLILRHGQRWQVRHGPFSKRDFATLPLRYWTLLVQGVDHCLPNARALLDAFNFIPYARLDDLMVSYAAPGGGVGPHVDSYDVFLIQAEGRRRWQISAQRDSTLVPDAPLNILQRFRATREWTLEPGDLLYLPPRYAHDGVALGACVTCSVGFRAPSAQDLCSRFYDYLQDHLDVAGQYADPQLRPTRHPARLDPALRNGMMRLLGGARWTRSDMLRYVGTELSTPKPQVRFDPPRRPLSARGFTQAVIVRGALLSPKTILLYDNAAFYVNGEHCAAPVALRRPLRQLADRRRLAPSTRMSAAVCAWLYPWYRAGYLHIAAPA